MNKFPTYKEIKGLIIPTCSRKALPKKKLKKQKQTKQNKKQKWGTGLRTLPSKTNFKYLFEKDILINMFKNVLVRRIIIIFYILQIIEE